MTDDDRTPDAALVRLRLLWNKAKWRHLMAEFAVEIVGADVATKLAQESEAAGDALVAYARAAAQSEMPCYRTVDMTVEDDGTYVVACGGESFWGKAAICPSCEARAALAQAEEART